MFRDRRDAGRQLTDQFRELAAARPVVLGFPRGGVPVAAEVARALEARLDVLVVHKLGCPGRPELGIGAIGEGGIQVLNEDLVARARLSARDLEQVATRELTELERRVQRYRGGRRPVAVGARSDRGRRRASPPSPPLEPRSRWCAAGVPDVSSWRCPWRRTTPSRGWPRSLTRSCVCRGDRRQPDPDPVRTSDGLRVGVKPMIRPTSRR